MKQKPPILGAIFTISILSVLASHVFNEIRTHYVTHMLAFIENVLTFYFSTGPCAL